MPTVPKGIDALPAAQVPDTWSARWFMELVRTWLRAADVRNATVVAPLHIVGNGTTPATISISGQTTTITTAKLTPGGTQGSLVFTNGILTSSVQAT